MTALITGASGFIGHALARRLGASGESPLLVVRQDVKGLPGGDPSGGDPSGGDPSGVQRQVSDLSDLSAADFHGVDTVYHLAGAAHRYGLGEKALNRVNVLGTQHVLTAAREAGVQRFVFLSSVKVNCETSAEPVGPDADCFPEDAYGMSKLAAEKVVLQSGLDAVILRLPLVYGVGAKGNFKALVGLVERGLPLPFRGVRSVRSYLGLENLLDFLALCRVSGPVPAGTYYLADPIPLSLPEMLTQIGEASGHPVRLFNFSPRALDLLARLVVGQERSNKLLGSLVVDTSMTTKATGWMAPYSTRECLARMFGHLDQPC